MTFSYIILNFIKALCSNLFSQSRWLSLVLTYMGNISHEGFTSESHGDIVFYALSVTSDLLSQNF